MLTFLFASAEALVDIATLLPLTHFVDSYSRLVVFESCPILTTILREQPCKLYVYLLERLVYTLTLESVIHHRK